MNIHLATDHAGLELKNAIKDYLIGKGHDVTDHGAHEYDAQDDYPDFIFPCARAVAVDPESRGIILGGSGQGEAMAANRIKGVRAAVYYGSERQIARLSREHNNANVLSLGARFISEQEIYDIIETWLDEPFEGGRHQRRIEKLDE
ncbi:MAG TPA: RpiB/LacA/LacB family sugar-phosphate isomerase [Candidatus Marinimicrobia bacterium]|jgi:ribose 5-phosphate isomerase B|nr:ribose-5-phosphate isomerase [Candidatus Neomarinimicrobiota bacterium]MDP6275497.1 RpiB/LacA/LacB family sugar-phosphate isomerase [Candidatus Neomarinimicrobiota bacterium]MDP7217771.1 RpiB/LacA/LacB family sugar-phosphate isomerase [Candidatus Neomarinimicrobiota bacterium]MDP7436498.1 RpiB/LacA/LacB family sugar-phosphate isomerase [Candidatus Neomarinimicrobiota bacterium]HJL74666.1 RpiB/LacA/LacB family sugar-phosphate isomerase [Candidatus Neomarinimicrobiota bacterium]|tara:strand:- start:2606 stop:3043 length:438 start_codon:yes stop_codon:yes gene_type:complete